MSRLSSYAVLKTSIRSCLIATATLFVFLSLSIPSANEAHACQFLVPDARGAAQQGPNFEGLSDGFTHGLLDCGTEFHNLVVITLGLDPSQDHIGVRDDPLFLTDVTGDLRPVSDVPVGMHSKVHVLGRVNQSPFIGVRRGFVRFATLCDANHSAAPLDCSWGSSRIKFRTTILDTDQDQKVDRSYHELSIYNEDGRLHMITFWTPYRDQIQGTANDWLSALKALGLDVAKTG